METRAVLKMVETNKGIFSVGDEKKLSKKLKLEEKRNQLEFCILKRVRVMICVRIRVKRYEETDVLYKVKKVILISSSI